MCIRTVTSRDKIPQFQVNDAVSQFDIDKEQVDITITDAFRKLKKKLIIFISREMCVEIF